MQNLLDKLPLNGSKTYITAGLLALYGVLGLVLGQLDQQAAVMLVLNALGLAGLRHGIDKK